MTANLILPILMRWTHIIAAITAVGGTIFIRFVLIPSAEKVLSPAEHSRLRETLIGRWQHVIHACILAFLVSGFYNYLVITRFDHQGQALYHALFGVKFLLAMFVFAMAIALTSKRPWSEALRGRMRLWGGLLAAVAIVVVMLSGVLKNLPKTTGVPEAAAASEREMSN